MTMPTKPSCLAIALLSATAAFAQPAQMQCRNNESDEPYNITLQFNPGGRGTVQDPREGADRPAQYAVIGSMVVLFDGENSRVVDTRFGRLGYAEGDARSWTEPQVSSKTRFSTVNKCQLVSGSLPGAVAAARPGAPAAPPQQATAAAPAGLAYDRPFTFTRGKQHGDGRYILSLQDDGNFVVKTVSGGFVHGFNNFISPDRRTRIAEVRFQADGNLAAYDADGRFIWSAMDKVNPGGRLVLQPNGDLLLVNASGMTEWAFSWKK